jgi:hypothetical protein
MFSNTGNLCFCEAVEDRQTNKQPNLYLVFRLRDISEELLTVVAEVLLSELTFLRLVDTVSRGDNNVSYVTSGSISLVSPALYLESLTKV